MRFLSFASIIPLLHSAAPEDKISEALEYVEELKAMLDGISDAELEEMMKADSKLGEIIKKTASLVFEIAEETVSGEDEPGPTV